jgi:hypothetical protein
VHHVLRVVIQLAAFLGIPSGVVALFTPLPIIVVIANRCVVGHAIENHRTYESSRFVLDRDRFEHQGLRTSKHTARFWSVFVDSEKFRRMLDRRRMAMGQIHVRFAKSNRPHRRVRRRCLARNKPAEFLLKRSLFRLRPIDPFVSPTRLVYLRIRILHVRLKTCTAEEHRAILQQGFCVRRLADDVFLRREDDLQHVRIRARSELCESPEGIERDVALTVGDIRRRIGRRKIRRAWHHENATTILVRTSAVQAICVAPRDAFQEDAIAVAGSELFKGGWTVQGLSGR